MTSKNIVINKALERDKRLFIYGIPITFASAVPPMQKPVTAAKAKLEYAKFFSS
jgi:hypothetical protein